jgi:protein TonB
MRIVGVIFAILVALIVHAAILAFGGWFFMSDEKKEGTTQIVDLLTEDDTAAKKEDEPEEKPEEAAEKIEVEEPPDAADLIKSLEEQPAATGAPELEAVSLSQLEAALSGRAVGGGGDFGTSLSLASGGVIGGTGKAGSKSSDAIESAFNLAEIDQKPRAVFQASPVYPAELRSKKLEGVVTVIFVVDAAGKVNNVRLEKSSHPAFEKPALDAIRKWKFEPAVKGGERVACKMRVPVRFQPR